MTPNKIISCYEAGEITEKEAIAILVHLASNTSPDEIVKEIPEHYIDLIKSLTANTDKKGIFFGPPNWEDDCRIGAKNWREYFDKFTGIKT